MLFLALLCFNRCIFIWRANKMVARKSKLQTNRWHVAATKKFHLSVQPSAASPGKKRKNDDHSIFPTVAVAAKGRCFLLQPRQTDNHDGVINKRENAVETRRKLESAKKESTVLPSKFAWRSEISCSESEASRSISATSKEDLPTEDFAASHTRDIRDSTCCRGRCEESKIHENVASLRNQQNDLDETANDAARSHIPNIGLWDRDTDNLLQSELRDELGYRLMLHRLEVCVSPTW